MVWKYRYVEASKRRKAQAKSDATRARPLQSARDMCSQYLPESRDGLVMR